MGSRLKRWFARSRAAKRAAIAFVIVLAAPWLLLVVLAAFTPLPPALRENKQSSTSTVIRDRHGVVIRELFAGDGLRARWLTLDELGDRAPRAVLAAEDRRFSHHFGVDPIAITRAFGQMLWSRRIVSGASTITQQLARTLVERPRTFRGKLAEMALALRIEWSLSKREILEQYVNRVTFGPGLRGIEAASRFYFDKPTSQLSLAEVAALAGMPRGPSIYDPRKNKERVLRRRDRVLDRMAEAGFAPLNEVESAKREPLVTAPVGSGIGAPHLIRGLMAGTIDPRLGPLRNRTREMVLTIDRGLQREIEAMARETVRSLEKRHVTAASVVVLDNASGEVLAYVGSPDIGDEAHLGHNDGVLALRQPGSTLKPFVYELAMEQLDFSAATVLPDVELYLPTKDGDYHPNNYDGRFHGPVRLREALANSYNVPAVWTAAALGPGRVLERLEALGIQSLTRDAEHYGVAIALGDGEVRLLDLANAYATLARGGELRPVSALKSALSKEGEAIALPASESRRVMDEAAASVITDILSDKNARIASFGEGNVLELDFPVAAKTGTSKGFRDNYTLGVTESVTVGVWVGNFDGSPMEGTSGITGAAPLFRDAMVAAMRGRSARGFTRPNDQIEEQTICSLSGERPTHACVHTRSELFVRRPGKETGPRGECSMHEEVLIDPRNGLRAGRGCAIAEERVFESYDAQFLAWARSAGRPLAPDAFSPLCPASEGEGSERATARGRGRLRVVFPTDGSSFTVDPGLMGKQSIWIRTDVPAGVSELRFVIDGRRATVRAPFRLEWPLQKGRHRVHVEGAGETSEEVEFEVD